MALCVCGGRGDTLRLRNGATVNGSFLGGSADEVRFMVDDQVRAYPRGEVAEVVFSSIGAGGSAPPPPVAVEPEVSGEPFLRGAARLIPLEREMGMMVRGGGAYGMGGSSVYRIPGGNSPVRVRRGDRVVFVVRLNGGAGAGMFQLYRLESRMNYRQTLPAMGGRPAALAVTISNVGGGVYEIAPVRQLIPGEYALSPMDSNQSYCFGVDY